VRQCEPDILRSGTWGTNQSAAVPFYHNGAFPWLYAFRYKDVNFDLMRPDAFVTCLVDVERVESRCWRGA
jgi:hypothetical protein